MIISINIEYLYTRASGIKSKLLIQTNYASLMNFESIDEIISYLSSNSEYKNIISQYYTRITPVFSFIKAIHFLNNNRWLSLTRNIDYNLKINIIKIQQVIDIKNTLLIFNLFPNFQNDQNINIESFFSSFNFGGAISFYNWVELSKDFSLQNFLAKTVFLAPPIHKFFSRLNHNFDLMNINLTALKEITEISFTDQDSLGYDLTLNLLGFDMNLYVLRFLSRHASNLSNETNFLRLKQIIAPWNSVKTFMGKELFSFEKFETEIVKSFLERILSFSKKFDLEVPSKMINVDTFEKSDFIMAETLMSTIKLHYLKNESVKDDQLGKLYFVLMLLVQEIENLSTIFFGKMHGLPNKNISEKVIIL